MDNQHKLIKGYRDLSAEEIALMNEIKAKGEELRALVGKIGQLIEKPLPEITEGTGELVAGLAVSVEYEADDPMYWLRYAESSFRCGVMYAVRAVAQPTSY
ncbi:hypothetical protein [Herbaspirillum sp. ST 5-3]|uniref:Acb2/Tad1 domain-containing protein n=1 Tax=Oxalobacteraceae TaxID=75682 RepID=UPI0010A3304F|nr:hypothetical protein [Herbaspirillum sp. ST 5-3]